MKLKAKMFLYCIINIAAVIIILTIADCQRSNDKPPKMEGPEPEPHQGVFISQNAVFTFDGSNKTVFVEFDDEYMEALNNPPNNTYYSYVFTWYDFGEYRYDGATSLKLYHEESDTYLTFMLQGNTSSDKITISHIVPGDENIVFIKQ